VHPIERLRYVARSEGVDPTMVALEAADALEALSFDQRALVLACRRLLDAQTANGALWWLCAHVLSAPDPGRAAAECRRGLLDDPTRMDLAYGLAAGAVVVAEAASQATLSLADRPDLDLRVVGDPWVLRGVLAELSEGVAGGPTTVGYLTDELAGALEGVGVVVVEALAGCPTRVLLRAEGAALAAASQAQGASLVAVVGAGVALPEPLFDACLAALTDPTVVPAGCLDKVAGPLGLSDPAEGLDPGGCPSPASLGAGPRRR